MKKALYAFSGDPITYGHIDIIKRASKAFDHVTVGIGVNPQKNYLFSLDERTQLAEISLRGIPNTKVIPFSGMLVDYAYENSIEVIVKGVRNSEDFSYENVLHQVGESQKLGIDTHILFARPHLVHVSSSAVKEIQRNQGDIHDYVPLCVKQKLEEKISNQYIIGITGEMGAGKSYISQKLCESKCDIPVHNIELDHIGHQILEELSDPAYKNIRKEIADNFGRELLRPDSFIDRKTLGNIVFNDVEKLQKLNNLLYTPINIRLRKAIQGMSGIILINAALLAETDMLHICNNNIILLNVSKNAQCERLKFRNLNQNQIDTRISCQYHYDQKISKIEKIINRDNYGKLWTIDSNEEFSDQKADTLLEEIKKYFSI